MWSFLASATFWGFVINILGLVVGIAGVGMAIRSHFKLQDARDAAKATQDKLFHHMAAEQFGDMSRDAGELALLLKSRDWNSILKIGTSLELALRDASGAWWTLLSAEEKDKMEVAKEYVGALLASVPIEGQAAGIEHEAVQAMMTKSRFAMDVTGEIRGRLRVARLEAVKEV